MSQFSDAISLSFGTSLTVFGDPCVIGTSYATTCVVHSLGGNNAIDGKRPGRVEEVNGQIVVTAADWAAAGAHKGTKITVNGVTVRVVNDPAYGPVSGEVLLTVQQV